MSATKAQKHGPPDTAGVGVAGFPRETWTLGLLPLCLESACEALGPVGAREGRGCAGLRLPALRPMGLPGRTSLLPTPGDAEKKQLVELHKSGLFLFQGLKIDSGSCGSGRPDCLKLSLCQGPARQQFSRKAILLC